MAEGGGYSEEVILNYLVAKFHVDPQSVQQAMQDMKALFAGQREEAKAESDLAGQDYNASLEIQKEMQKKYFEDIEAALKKHWEARLAAVKKGTDEALAVEKKYNEDMKMLEDVRNKASEEKEKTEKETHEKHTARHYEGLKFGNEQIGMAKALGFGEFAGLLGAGVGIAGVTALVGLIVQSAENLRQTGIEARSIARAGGMESDFALPVAGGLTELSREKNMSREDVSKVMRAFLPMAKGGEEGGREMVGLTRQAMESGFAGGVSFLDTANLMTKFHILENIPAEQLSAKFNDVVAAAKSADIPAQTFVGWLTTAVDAGRLYNVSIDESKNMLLMFSRELREGTLTIQQLTAVQQIVAKSPEGFQAMIAERVMEKGGPLADYLKSVGATTPLGRAAAIRALGEGAMINPETRELYTPQSGPERTRMDALQLEAQKEYQAFFKENADKLGMGAADYIGVTGKVAGLAGIRPDTMFGGQEMIKALGIDFSGITRGSDELEKAAIAHRKAAEDNLKATDEMSKSASAQRRAWNKFSEWIDIANYAFEEAGARARGDWEKAEDIRKTRDEYEAGKTTQAGRAMALERLNYSRTGRGRTPVGSGEHTLTEGGDVYIVINPDLPPVLIKARNVPADTVKESGRVKKIIPREE